VHDARWVSKFLPLTLALGGGARCHDALGRGVSAISIKNAIRLRLAGRAAGRGGMTRWKRESRSVAATGLCTVIAIAQSSHA
jgi:hypothetical protein